MLDSQQGSGNQAEPFEFTQSRWIAVRNTANRGRFLKRPMSERHFFEVNAGLVFLRNRVAVRVDFRIAKDCRYPVLKTLGNEMLQPLCLFVDFVPGVLQNIMEKQFEQPMMPHQFPRSLFPRGGQPNSSMLFMHNKSRPLRGEPFEHPGHRRRANSQPFGKGVCRDAQFLRAAQFQDCL